MKQKTFFIVFEGLPFGEKYKIYRKQQTQALTTFKHAFEKLNIKIINYLRKCFYPQLCQLGDGKRLIF